MERKNNCIFYVVNVDWFFISHRLPLAEEALKRGYEVYVLTKNTGRKNEIEKNGIKFIDIDFERSGKSIINEIKVMFNLYKAYKKHKPSIVHHVTIKPAVYGTMILRVFPMKNTKIVNAISGLGYNFTNSRKTIFQSVLLKLMKFSFSYSRAKFIFQNPDDLDFYAKQGFISPNNFTVVKGSGVDEKKFPYILPPQNKKLSVVLPARMLFDKGIVEFCKAAEILKGKWESKVIFSLVGQLDPENLAGANYDEIKQLLIDDYIEWRGYEKDMIKVLSEADIVCLPSYREGLPKSLVEAMAIGRPIVTTNSPGCRECVIDGHNGYLVPVKDLELLADRLDKLLNDSSLRIKMGELSRQKMLNEMSLSKVIYLTFDFYDRIN